jgi:hypothetical protein
VSIWEQIANGAAEQSELWGQALSPAGERSEETVFSQLCPDPYALGLETIYEGYLAHFAKPRLFAVPNPERALLLGDYLYAHGLVRIADLGDVQAIEDLAALISLCARLRGDGAEGDGELWAATAVSLGAGEAAAKALREARELFEQSADAQPLAQLARGAAGDEAVDRALAAHAALLGARLG